MAILENMGLRIHGLLIIVIAFVLGFSLTYLFLDRKKSDNSTLVLVHLIFRHGAKNPERLSLYPSCPQLDEKYYPEGLAQLTDAGKKTAYKIGVDIRKRYHDFMEEIWNVKHLEARTTDLDRTKMSLSLVLAGMYPAKPWAPPYFQPIPYNYVPQSRDKEFVVYRACPGYEPMLKESQKRPEISEYLQRYKETYEILAKRTNRTMDVKQAFFLYLGFECREGRGYPLEEWTKAVYPEPLHSITVDMYHLMTNTTTAKRMVTGYVLKKVLADTKAKIDGTLKPPERKMFIYSAHELNIATILLSLKAFKVTQVPPFGAYILFEVHKIDGVYGIKLFYQNYKQEEPIALKIPGCNHFCPYDDFYKSIKEIIPSSDEDCFGPS